MKSNPKLDIEEDKDISQHLLVKVGNEAVQGEQSEKGQQHLTN